MTVNPDTGLLQSQNNSRADLKKWTIMVYMDGDNNLEKFAIQDFNELETVESNDDINILVQIDRHPNSEESQGFTSSNGDWNETRRYFVKFDLTADANNFTKYNQDVDMWSLGEQNMGDPETLKGFLEWGITNYPSEHYLIVMWDHGTGIFSSRGYDGYVYDKYGGGSRSFCDDSTNGCSMKLWELDEVLKETKNLTKNKKFDIVGFDMCWLGYIETGYEIMDSVDYLVASSDEEPDVGWDYGPPLHELEKDPNMSPRDFAITITNEYIKEFQDIPSVSYMTQATVDLKEMANELVPKFNAFADELRSKMIDYEGYIVQARDLTDEPLNKPIYADIYHFAELISESTDLPESLRSTALNVLDGFDKVVIAEGHGVDHPNTHGLSVYFPRTVSLWYSQYTTSLDFADENWDEFIKFYLHPVQINHTPLKDTEMVGPHKIISVVRGNDIDKNKIYVWYSTDGITFKSINLKETGNYNEYSGLISNQSLGTTIYYYLEVVDTTKYSTLLPSNASKDNLDSLFSFYVGLDIIAPEIEHNQITDFVILVIDQPYNVNVKITDNIDLDSEQLHMFYNIDNGSNFNKLLLSAADEPDEYFCLVPAQDTGTTIYYYFEAVDGAITPNTARLPLSGVFETKVISARPQPSFVVNRTTIFTFENVKFTSTSTDDQAIVKWTWQFNDGNVLYGPEVTRIFTEKGVYSVTLTVLDDTDLENHITVDITIENQPPIAKLTPDTYIMVNDKAVKIVNGKINETIYEDDEITFMSNVSKDIGGYITTFNWDFGDGVTHYEHWVVIVNGGYDPKFDPVITTYYPQGYDKNYSIPDNTFDGITTHKYIATQEYTVTLTVTDIDGAETNTSMKIKVENLKPTSSPGYTSIDGKKVSFSAYFLGKNIPDSDSDIKSLTYTWDFGDGSTGNGINVTHTYKKDGKFGVLLTVTDDDGAYDTQSIIIEIDQDDDSDLGLILGVLIILIVVIVIVIFFIIKQKPVKTKSKRSKPVRRVRK
jgi:PKD repeat protein